METINKILVNDVDYDIVGKELTKITYAELKALRDNGELLEGHLYRITDYVTTTSTSQTKSAGNAFDVIVLAISTNELSHNAKAIQHEGDTYFDGNDLGAWELWYDLDNDTEKYEWADATNGKGVIYRMIDEKRNDCPYDFKNILFYNDKLIDSATSDKYYYTFSYVVSGKLYDGTVEKLVTTCYSNNMGIYINNKKRSLNKNVFRNISFGTYCNNNTFDTYCNNNTFGNSCYGNTFGDSCNSNTFGNSCYSNTFGNSCDSNTFGGYCYANTFGNSCYGNTFGNSCNSNTFGDICYGNTFGNSCYSNTFGNSCNSNTFGGYCYANTFGNYCESNTFGYDSSRNTFGDYCVSRHIDCSKTSITINDEYYDDKSGQLVPIRHPDLSTQPSILPYKFMGQYVYEQLIPLTESEKQKLTTNEGFELYLNTAERLIEFAVDNPIFIDASIFAWGRDDISANAGNMPLFSPAVIDTGDSDPYHPRLTGFTVTYKQMSSGFRMTEAKHAYLRVVYTQMPEEGGGYYGYNNY